MPFKRIKDESDLKSKYKIFCNDKYHYFHIFLWKTQKAFDENTLDNIPKESAACVNLAPTIIEYSNKVEKEIIRPKLGEIHFISKKWSLEIIAHELCHALVQRLRMIKKPTLQQVIEQYEDSEEEICYEFGSWVDMIYRLLYKDDYGE